MVEMGEELVRVEDVYKISDPSRGSSLELSQGGMGKERYTLEPGTSLACATSTSTSSR